jgi:4-amino-4-deoxy-L-arabinose transferase-like glycosyltransferase
MDWNLRARLIFRAGTDWRDAFSGLIPWSHPDYPLVVQGSVVRAWTYAGGERLAASAMVALVFTAATVALAGAALALLRSRGQAALAALVLLGTPFFIAHGASQFADVPVGFFFLATVILLSLHHRHAVRTLRFAGLAGFACGLAMWTKNEGLLFLVSVVAAQLVAGIGKGRAGAVARQLLAFGAGLLLPAILLVYFKIRFAPPNDLISTVGAGQTLAWLLDPRRHAIALLAFGKHILGFGNNGLVSGVWLLVTYSLCVGIRVPPEDRRWAVTIVLAIVAMLAGHFLVFVGTTPDVARLLDSSLDRLLLQLWPSAVFLCFMLLPVPEATVETAPRAIA